MPSVLKENYLSVCNGFHSNCNKSKLCIIRHRMGFYFILKKYSFIYDLKLWDKFYKGVA